MSQGGRTLQLFRSPPHTCSYLPEQISSSAFIDPGATLDPASYGALLDLGFRRSGHHVYRPHCPDCQACIPARIAVDSFHPRRSQRRTLRVNNDLQLRNAPARLTDEQFALYQAYTGQRHEDGAMAAMTAEACAAFLTAQWCATEFLEFRIAGRLVGVAVTDQLPDALSAVYTFFDPALRRRALGAFAILQQIEQARVLGLDYLYLGYWIGACRKMRYKGDYRPLQLRVGEAWRTFAAREPLPGESPLEQRA
jgi:arginine-tRNA-protein transferase